MTRDIEHIIDAVRRQALAVSVEQLKVVHPGADDDGLWFFSLAGREGDIQLESSTGMCPFLIEADDAGPIIAGTVEEAARVVLAFFERWT